VCAVEELIGRVFSVWGCSAYGVLPITELRAALGVLYRTARRFVSPLDGIFDALDGKFNFAANFSKIFFQKTKKNIWKFFQNFLASRKLILN